jgi:hypothetical protein
VIKHWLTACLTLPHTFENDYEDYFISQQKLIELLSIDLTSIAGIRELVMIVGAKTAWYSVLQKGDEKMLELLMKHCVV